MLWPLDFMTETFIRTWYWGLLRFYLWQNLIQSAYLVNRGYANFPKTAWMRIICAIVIHIYCINVHWAPDKNTPQIWTSPFSEICKTLVYKPIRSYQIQHLKVYWPAETQSSSSFGLHCWTFISWKSRNKLIKIY